MKRIWILIILFGIIYLLFPSNNLSLDSISYACDVKYNKDLFAPHHLLYNSFNYLIYSFICFFIPSIDVIKLMQFVNGIFALSCLFILYQIILKKSKNTNTAFSWTFFTGCCFGVMRYAVEAETYIIPIFFSLMASYFYLLFTENNKNKFILYTSLFASVACLFHQIHLFWGIGLFIAFLRTKRLKNVLLFSLPTLGVLVIYSLVLIFYQKVDFSFQNLLAFLLDYYYSDNADIHIGSVNFLLTPISFFRTFFQVHGSIINILRLVPFFYVIILVVIVLLILFIYNLKHAEFKKNSLLKPGFESTHLIIFILQLIFAFFSHGNAEFMIMLPFLLAFIIPSFVSINPKAIQYLSLSMLLWNFCFAIFPGNNFNYYNNEELVEIIKENPEKSFLLREVNVIKNQFYYEAGYEAPNIVHKVDEVETDFYYTDILSKKMPFSRAHITVKDNFDDITFIEHFKLIEADFGNYYIDKVN